MNDMTKIHVKMQACVVPKIPFLVSSGCSISVSNVCYVNVPSNSTSSILFCIGKAEWQTCYG